MQQDQATVSLQEVAALAHLLGLSKHAKHWASAVSQPTWSALAVHVLCQSFNLLCVLCMCACAMIWFPLVAILQAAFTFKWAALGVYATAWLYVACTTGNPRLSALVAVRCKNGGAVTLLCLM
jgi:hypothetical protein